MKNNFPAQLFFTFLLVSCSSLVPTGDHRQDAHKTSAHAPGVEFEIKHDHDHSHGKDSEKLEQIVLQDTKVKSSATRKELKNSASSSTHISDIKIVKNESVQWWIDYFQKRDKKRFQRFLNRGQYYKELVQTILEENGLPNELYYLAMIESGFVRTARSHASAVGTWQFMKGTGKMYGLDVNSYLDERKDPIRATEAATKYLRDLYTAFKSWDLALAAYNCGEHRVLRSVMRGDSRDFWSLKERKFLPRETRNYIPKFLAAVHIGSNPEAYGFTDPAKTVSNVFPDVESVEVPGGVSLKKISKYSGISLSKLESVNSHLKRGMTPARTRTYEIWVPAGHGKRVTKINPVLTPYRQRNISSSSNSPKKNYHIVRRGENLSSIARKYNEKIAYLKRLNGIKGSNIYPGQKLRINAKKYRSAGGSNYYFVKPGDNLSKISEKFNITLRSLRRINNLKGNKIYAGQKLKVGTGHKLYKVRRGDNLHNIASRFGTSIRRIKNINNLINSKILIGQVLKI